MAVKISENNTVIDQKDKTVLTGEQTSIVGVPVFGYATNNKTALSLLEHHHRTKFEFIIALSGMQKIVVCDVEYTIYGGEIFIVQPNEVHVSGENIGSTERMWFQIDVSSVDEFLGLDANRATYILKKLTFFDGRKFQLDEGLINGFKRVFDLISSSKVGDKIKGQSLFIYCLLSLLERPSIMSKLSPEIDKAKQYILTHIEDKIDMDVLIGKSGVSLSQFKQRFKDQIGYSPRDYINFVKVNSAKERVATTRDSFTEIAYDYSFSTGHFFCVAFKQYIGCTPKEYRKRFKSK